jgi:RNA polymerase sigma factor (TIGR02999 family)
MPDGTLATTALVNEAYLKLVSDRAERWASRSHFLAVVALAMRQILIDRARAHLRLKRGAGERPATLSDAAQPDNMAAEQLLEINDALDALAAVEPRLARVVELRFFGGLAESEIAEALDVTVRTVQRDWVKARLLLRRALGD